MVSLDVPDYRDGAGPPDIVQGPIDDGGPTGRAQLLGQLPLTIPHPSLQSLPREPEVVVLYRIRDP